ncbi:uncharacterized protein LOC131945249 [Physella acuta]|uniref:uncharacterized protein LOC131945249 n=1 Tax=Physella acuta TaxID=109671 RepID=UPI0027DD72F4|nr:uncharacterized protein LOC131945249 [Physella acuta]
MLLSHGLQLWLLIGVLQSSALSWSRDGFINTVTSAYRAYDQANRADTTKDGVITEAELANSLYRQADAYGNNDNRASRVEFIDYYTQIYNVSSELAAIMFDLLNDPSKPDDVITSSDVSLTSFSGRKYATVSEFREGLEKWIRRSAEKLYSILMIPHIIDPRNEPELRYGTILENIDANKDGYLTVAELSDEFKRFSPTQSIKRRDWTLRNTQGYGADPAIASLVFDYWNRDGDSELTLRDLQRVVEEMDINGDQKISSEEFIRFVERGYKLGRRMVGVPLSESMVQCPEPWWSSMGWTPAIDATRAAMDFDDDFDGWITSADLRRWLHVFDDDNDGSVNRREHNKFHTHRYGVNSSTASAMFDLADVNADDKLDDRDWEFHFKGDFSLSFCDVKRSIQDLARVAEKQQGIRQGKEMRENMKRQLQEELSWFLEKQPRQRAGWPGTQERQVRCKTRLVCYVGEYTQDWWRPEATLWWKVDLREDNRPLQASLSEPRQPPPANFRQSALTTDQGVLPPIARVGLPMIPDADIPFPQPQWPMYDMGNFGHMSGMSPFTPYKRSADEKLRMKNSQTNAPIGSNKEYFSDYHRLFNTYEPDQQTPNRNADIKEENVYQNLPDQTIESTVEEDTDSQQNKQINSNLQRSFSSDNSEASKMAVNKEEKKNTPNQEEFVSLPPPLTLLGYPVFVGVDPWLLNGPPNWGMLGRKKRESQDDKKKNEEIREASGEKKERTGENYAGVDNSTDSLADFMAWAGPSLLMAASSPGFGVAPWDLWMAMALDSAMWEAMQFDDWTNSTDNDTRSNRTGAGERESWKNLMDWMNDNDGQDESQESEEEGATEEDFTQSAGGESRGKRFIQGYENFFHKLPFWASRSSSYWPSEGFFNDWRGRSAFSSPWNRFWQFGDASWNYPLNRLRWFSRIKRSAENAQGEVTDGDAERDQRSKTTDNARNDFFFDKWKSEDEDLQNGQGVRGDNKDSVWRSASSNKYGSESDWEHKLDAGSSQWNMGAKEKFGSHSWSNGRMSTSFQRGDSDWLGNVQPTGKWNQPYFPDRMPEGGQQMPSAGNRYNMPQNFGRNFIPTPMVSPLISQKQADWPSWYSNIDQPFNYNPNTLNRWFNFPGQYFNQATMEVGPEKLPTPRLNSPFDELMPFWAERFIRGTLPLRRSEDKDDTLSGKSDAGQETEANDQTLIRKKRWEFANFYNQFLPRTDYFSWLYHLVPWCQRYWNSARFGRSAPDSTEENVDKRSTLNDQDKEKRWDSTEDNVDKRSTLNDNDKEKRWDHGAYSYNWMAMSSVCPRVWSFVQTNNIPLNGYPGRNQYFPYQQFRQKRDAHQTTKETLDETKLKRWNSNDADCEEWQYVTSAWTPWQGLNMLRSARGATHLEGNKLDDPLQNARNTRAVRCKSWHRKDYNQNIFGANQQWTDSQPSRAFNRFKRSSTNSDNTEGTGEGGDRIKRFETWSGVSPFWHPGRSLGGQWWNSNQFNLPLFNNKWMYQGFGGNKWNNFGWDYLRSSREVEQEGLSNEDLQRPKRNAQEDFKIANDGADESASETREKRMMGPWVGSDRYGWLNQFSSASNPYQWWATDWWSQWNPYRFARETEEGDDDKNTSRNKRWLYTGQNYLNVQPWWLNYMKSWPGLLWHGSSRFQRDAEQKEESTGEFVKRVIKNVATSGWYANDPTSEWTNEPRSAYSSPWTLGDTPVRLPRDTASAQETTKRYAEGRGGLMWQRGENFPWSNSNWDFQANYDSRYRPYNWPWTNALPGYPQWSQGQQTSWGNYRSSRAAGQPNVAEGNKQEQLLDKNKRWSGFDYPNFNSMYFPEFSFDNNFNNLNYNYRSPWDLTRYLRNTETADKSSEGRSKRWLNYGLNPWQMPPFYWQNSLAWINNPWNWMRFTRNVKEDGSTKDERFRRDAQDVEREKRFDNYNWPLWTSPFYSDYMAASNPYYRWNYDNVFRYPRKVQEDSHDSGREKRNAIDAPEEGDRNKRWQEWYSNPQWSTYRPWSRYRWMSDYSKEGDMWNFMRYTRNSGEPSETERQKRQLGDQLKEKRWSNPWNQMNFPWYLGRNAMSFPYSYSNFWEDGRWYHDNRFLRNADGETEEANVRSKRWQGWDFPPYAGWNQRAANFNNFMTFGYPGINTYQNPYFFHKFFTKRENPTFTKSENEETSTERTKRWQPFPGFSWLPNMASGNPSFGYPQGWWNPSVYPMVQYYMNRFQRQAQRENNEQSESRRERDTEGALKNKRWLVGENYLSGAWDDDQSFSPWSHSNWSPWWMDYWNSARFARKTEENNQRNKRDTEKRLLNKRWNTFLPLADKNRMTMNALPLNFPGRSSFPPARYNLWSSFDNFPSLYSLINQRQQYTYPMVTNRRWSPYETYRPLGRPSFLQPWEQWWNVYSRRSTRETSAGGEDNARTRRQPGDVMQYWLPQLASPRLPWPGWTDAPAMFSNAWRHWSPWSNISPPWSQWSNISPLRSPWSNISPPWSQWSNISPLRYPRNSQAKSDVAADQTHSVGDAPVDTSRQKRWVESSGYPRWMEFSGYPRFYQNMVQDRSNGIFQRPFFSTDLSRLSNVWNAVRPMDYMRFYSTPLNPMRLSRFSQSSRAKRDTKDGDVRSKRYGWSDNRFDLMNPWMQQWWRPRTLSTMYDSFNPWNQGYQLSYSKRGVDNTETGQGGRSKRWWRNDNFGGLWNLQHMAKNTMGPMSPWYMGWWNNLYPSYQWIPIFNSQNKREENTTKERRWSAAQPYLWSPYSNLFDNTRYSLGSNYISTFPNNVLAKSSFQWSPRNPWQYWPRKRRSSDKTEDENQEVLQAKRWVGRNYQFPMISGMGRSSWNKPDLSYWNQWPSNQPWNQWPSNQPWNQWPSNQPWNQWPSNQPWNQWPSNQPWNQWPSN